MQVFAELQFYKWRAGSIVAGIDPAFNEFICTIVAFLF
jgi:hypothetical protein